MTCKVYPCEDPLFMQLAETLENYCLIRNCTSCARFEVCQRWFNTVSRQSSLGQLNPERLGHHLQTMRDIIFTKAGK